MMVTFISQCEKSSLNRTRRVLDAFADRIGDRTWQTVITHEGLNAVRKLLRKTASKNTAVSCHWIRSRSRSELVWVVGNRRKFNEQGLVAVNSTRHSGSYLVDEQSWFHAHSIQILVVLAALLHDIGKATIGFQNKLFHRGKPEADPYRHEWLSLRLFQAMIHGCTTDDEWLERLADFGGYMQQNADWIDSIVKDGQQHGKAKYRRLDAMPPLAQLISWLVVTHHRLPTYEMAYYKEKEARKLQKDPYHWGEEFTISEFYAEIEPFKYWVRNPQTDNSDDFWDLRSVVMASRQWQKSVTRWARKAREHQPLRELAGQPVSDPFIMHMSRLCLMLADHNYSSLRPDAKQRVSGDRNLRDLWANTSRQKGRQAEGKQALDEHLLGVADFAKKVTRKIPQLKAELPGLPDRHRPFTTATRHEQYLWQNHAFDLARQLQQPAREQGFFGINMASTGRGKTLANARIMYALGDSTQGPRFTIALGLRVLTLQTGRALRERLQLDDDLLAILVGGAASRKLFEMSEQDEKNNEERITAEDLGSESYEPLLDHSDFVDGSILSDEFDTLLRDPKTKQLLLAPVVTCTIDHLIQASESSRGGSQIAPILRLLTSDLILDEPDDFNQSDLPALARLVYFAGLFGSRVLLSSATLTPDFSIGLYRAYAAGRAVWNRHMGHNPKPPVCCAWFDEYQRDQLACADAEQFGARHYGFAQKRAIRLQEEPPRRRAAILPVELPPPVIENEKINYTALADLLIQGAFQLHSQHRETCPESGKHVSVGLLRMANVNPIVNLVQAIYQRPALQADVQLHLCCYHAKQLLVLRSRLERRLDRLLQRGRDGAIFTHPEIQQALRSSPAKQHIFLVVASPVAEVGRDHDYDWAIVEPSSMRSLIQLAGRVWRHRPQKIVDQPNLLILDTNMRALRGESIAFTKPGFEDDQFKLSSRRCHALLTPEQIDTVDARPRIVRPTNLQPTENLAHLEHAVMADLLNNQGNFVSAFWRPDNGNHPSAHLQKISPFRWSSGPQEDFVCLPLDEEGQELKFAYTDAAWDDLENCAGQSKKIVTSDFQPNSEWINPWLTSDLIKALRELPEYSDDDDLPYLARQYAQVRLDAVQNRRWNFHPWLGFWR